MAISTDRIKNEVFGRISNLPANSDVAGTIEQAKVIVQELRKWYADASGEDEGSYPSVADTWDELVELETIDRLTRKFKSVQDAAIFRQTQITPLLGALATTYIQDWGTTLNVTTGTITGATLRKSVISILVRQKEPSYPPLHEVDRAIYEEFAILWESRKWRFRRRPLWLKIKTDGTVVTGDNNVTFDSIASKVITIKDGTKGITECVWKDSTKFSDLMARYANETGKTGRPRWFYLIPEGDTEYIQFFPEPDKEYDAFAVIYTGVPELNTKLDSDDGLKKLPVAFRTHLRDRVLARVTREFGDPQESARIQDKVERDYLTLLAEYDDQGSNEWSASYYKPARFAKDFRSFNGRFLGGMG
jgi:hypothetical protein